jgi:hypothetical protein
MQLTGPVRLQCEPAAGAILARNAGWNGHQGQRTSEEEEKAMISRLTAAASTAFLALIGLGAGPTADRSFAWIDEYVAALQPTVDERRIDRIGWAHDIRSALRLAREHGRPVFLFTMDGRFSIGRC